MSDRSRTPTGDQQTGIYDPTTSRSKKPTARGVGSEQRAESLRQAQRQRAPSARRQANEIEMATPTEVTPPRDRSEPIRVISMKTPAELDAEKQAAIAAQQRVVKLRALSEVSSERLTRPPIGNLAPPRDPKEVRGRRVRDTLIWGSVVVIIGCAVMIAVWFLARR